MRVLLLNTDLERTFAVEVGDRIAQLVLVRLEPAELQEQLALESSSRGEGGLGSTGR